MSDACNSSKNELAKFKMATDCKQGALPASASPLEEGVALAARLLALSSPSYLEEEESERERETSHSLEREPAKARNPAWRPEKRERETGLGLGGPGLSGEQSHEVGPGRIPRAASTCHSPKEREREAKATIHLSSFTVEIHFHRQVESEQVKGMRMLSAPSQGQVTLSSASLSHTFHESSVMPTQGDICMISELCDATVLLTISFYPDR